MSKPAGWDPSAGDFKRSEEERTRQAAGQWVELQPGKAATPKGPLTEAGRSALDLVGQRMAEQRYQGGDLKALGERISKLSFCQAVREAEQFRQGKSPDLFAETGKGFDQSRPMFAVISKLYRERIWALYNSAAFLLGVDRVERPTLKQARELFDRLERHRENGDTPLIAALWDVEAVVDLIELGVDVNAPDDEDRTPLCRAARAGNLVVVQLLLAQPGVDLHKRDKFFKRTALYQAALYGSRESVRAICNAAAEMATRHMRDGTPELEANKAKAAQAARLEVLEARDKVGRTPLIGASYRTVAVPDSIQAGVIAELLQAGADVNARDKFGRTALMSAADSNAVEAAQVLLAADHIEINAKDDEGHTALHYATKFGNDAVAALLRDAGATQ